MRNSSANCTSTTSIPDNWSYIEGSNTPEAKNTGFGPLNSIELTPNEFSDILVSRDIQDGPYAQFIQDTDYPKDLAVIQKMIDSIQFIGHLENNLIRYDME